MFATYMGHEEIVKILLNVPNIIKLSAKWIKIIEGKKLKNKKLQNIIGKP